MIVRFLAAALIWLAATAEAGAQTTGRQARMVVELYTSQGCSQCPRANRLLGRLAREDGVLALTFPVTIWDYLGWRDTLAQPAFSERQRAYAQRLRGRGRFTPQLVVDGADQISASDWDAARAMVEAARQSPPAASTPDISITRLRGGRVRVTISARAQAEPADVWLVAYDPGPVTVAIAGGLNVNRSMTSYNLALEINRLGAWTGAAAWYERGGCSPRCAALVQGANGGPILAAAYVER